MYVFLDTNIYFNNWFLKSPPFAKLIKYCNDTDATLLLPEVVIEEVQAKYVEERDKLLKRVEADRRLCENFGYSSAAYTSNLLASGYNFAEVVADKFNSIKRLPYDNVPHRLLVNKAIQAKRPFTDTEKGYRDTLIWHTLIDFLQSSWAESSVAFITENVTDFYYGKESPLTFHADLLADLQEASVQNQFQLFRSIRGLVDANKIVRQGKVDHERLGSELLPAVESSAEEEAIDYLNMLPLEGTQQLFAAANFDSQAIALMQRVHWSIWEGTEDPKMGLGESLGGNAVFLPYEFNLRILEAIWTVSKATYFQHKAMLDLHFDNMDIDNNEVHLTVGARCYFRASFIVDVSEGEVLQASIDDAWLRPYGG